MGGAKPTYIRIIVTGEPKKVYSSRECDPLRWNAKASLPRGHQRRHRNLNACLGTLERKVADAYLQFEKDGVEITAETKAPCQRHAAAVFNENFLQHPLLPQALEIIGRYADYPHA